MIANIMRIPIRQGFLIVAIVTTLFCHTGYAGAVSTSGKAVREIVEELAQQIAPTARPEFTKTTLAQLEKITSICGNKSLDVIEKHGIVALRVFQNAGEEAGPYLVKGISLYGDDGLRLAQTAVGRSVLREGNEFAIRAVIKHTDAVVPLIRTYGDECAHVLTQLSPRNGRRLIQMVDEKSLASSDIQKLMGTIGKYGDDAMDFIWRNRKLLATATVLVAFINDPEPYLKGIKDLSKVLVDPIIQSINWNLWVGVVVMFAGLWFLFKRRAILIKQKNNKE